MPDPVRILLVSGSLRSGSTNSAVVRTAHEVAPDGVRTTIYDGLGDLPHFNPDDDVEGEPLAPAPRPARPARRGRRRPVLDARSMRARCRARSRTCSTGPSAAGTYGKPVAWVNASASPTGAAGAHASLRKVLTYTNTDIVEAACAHIPVPRHSIGADGLVGDPAIGSSSPPS